MTRRQTDVALIIAAILTGCTLAVAVAWAAGHFLNGAIAA